METGAKIYEKLVKNLNREVYLSCKDVIDGGNKFKKIPDDLVEIIIRESSESTFFFCFLYMCVLH